MRTIRRHLQNIEDITTQNKIECPFIAVLNWPEYIVLYENHIDDGSYIEWCYPNYIKEMREKSLETLSDFKPQSLIFILKHKEGTRYHPPSTQWIRLKTDVFLYSVSIKL